MTLSRRIEKYWDERSEHFSQSRRLELDGVDGAAWKNIFKKNLPKGKLKILDVGTGAGFFAAILSKLGHKVVGIDMSAKMLGEAEKNLRELNLSAEFKSMNAQALDFDDETFDALKLTAEQILSGIDGRLTLHDFRVVPYKAGRKLIFDVAVPQDFNLSDRDIRREFQRRLIEHNPDDRAIIRCDHEYC